MEEITYIWDIDYLKSYPTYEDRTDVVCTVHWKLVTTNGEYNSQLIGSIDVPTEVLEPFTPYDQLTKEQVLEWVQDVMGEEQVLIYQEAGLKKLNDLVNPPVVILPLPWVNQQTVYMDESEAPVDPETPDQE